MAVTLRGTYGDWTLPAGETILGRGDKAGLRIPDPRLSRAHVRFFVAATSCTVQELGSTNGVLVNGDQVRVAPIRNGDVVVCGPVAFTIVSDEKPNPERIVCLRGTQAAPQPGGRTDTMDPVELVSLSERHRRELSPGIAAAVSGIHVTNPGRPGSISHLPGTASTMIPDEQPMRPGSALTNSEIRPPPTDPLPGAPSRSTGLSPMTFTPAERSPLSVGPGTWTMGPGFRRRRIIAGLLEAVSVAIMAWGGLIIASAAGFAAACVAAKARLEGGLPVLVGTGESASWWSVMTSLGTWSGLERALALVPHLRGDSGAFAWLFAGLTLGLLAWTVAHAYVISTTVHSGAPPWHRRLGLVIVRADDGTTCGWPRAALRWISLGATLPLAAITVLLGHTGLHDRMAGTRLHDRRR